MADNTSGMTEAEMKMMAEAIYKHNQIQPTNEEVIKQAPVSAVSGTIDTILNAPSNLKNLGKMGSEFMDYAFGPTGSGAPIPSDYGQFDIPNNTVQDYLTGQGLIDPSLRERMSPEQKMADSAIQGAVGTVLGGAPKQLLTGGLSSLAGEAVSEATGSPMAGLATSILTPVGGSKIKALNASRIETEALNAVRDKTLADARALDMIVVPDNRIADFASRPKLLQAATEINQRITNKVARAYAGIAPDKAISRESLKEVRDRAYREGYEPLKRGGTVTTDNDYLNDLIDIESTHTGQAISFPEAVSKNLEDLVKAYTVSSFSSSDAVDKIRTLRQRATKYIQSDVPDNEEYGYAMRKVADAMEAQLERHVQNTGLPQELVQKYRDSRRLIARTHSVEDALEAGSGDVKMSKLGKLYDRGVPIDGDLEKVARFASINKPKTANPHTAGEPQKTPYSHVAGLGAGMATAHALDLPYWTYGALAGAGALAGREAHNTLAIPIRKAMLSRTGQEMLAPDYKDLGIDPRAGALSGLMFEHSNQE